MKFNSPLFDGIRVKPSEDRRPKTASHLCEWPGCKKPGDHRAPKERGRDGQYWRYCIDHVREYNHSYNFFAGMSDEAVLKYQKDALTGHRPTWKVGTGKKARNAGDFYAEGANDPFGVFHEVGGDRPHRAKAKEQRTIRNAERKAFDTLGLDADADKVAIKSKFKDLVKRHHPDVNGGDRSTEDRLVEIIQAYNYLKSAGFC
jgi:hypothetical protein